MTGYAPPTLIARFYADMGNKDKVFEWFDIAYREHDRQLAGLNVTPSFDNLRSDPRYAGLINKIGRQNSLQVQRRSAAAPE